MQIQSNANHSYSSPNSQNTYSEGNVLLTPNEAALQTPTQLELALGDGARGTETGSQTDSSSAFPDSIIQSIENEIAFNAPIRSISTLIPIDSVKFGRDCIELHNDIIRKLFSAPDMSLGDRIVGGPSSTHQILRNKGLAGPLKTFGFVTESGVDTKVNSNAHHLKESVGEYIMMNSSKNGVSVYGLGALDGYHSMLLTCRMKDGAPEFMLVDQGPATSLFTGKSVFTSAEELDSALSEYVRAKQDKRTVGGYEYPANIQIYQIHPDQK
ncbi:MAG: hypothetical protein PVI92_12580 [Chromatiales bacterium]|jgi:hypothetical protein